LFSLSLLVCFCFRFGSWFVSVFALFLLGIGHVQLQAKGAEPTKKKERKKESLGPQKERKQARKY